MNPSGRPRRLRAVVLAGVAYLVVGLVFGMLARDAGSVQIRDAWRLAAWAISALVFGAHIAYEGVRVRSSPGSTAMHASFGVALGALALAVGAVVHAHTLARHAPYLAYLVWPVAIAVPAFVVAVVAAALLARARRSS